MQKASADFSAYVPQHFSWLPWRLGNLRAFTLVVNQLVATKSHEAVSIFVTLWKCQFLMTSTENKMAFLGSSQYLWEYGTGKWAVAGGKIYGGPVDLTYKIVYCPVSAWSKIIHSPVEISIQNSCWPCSINLSWPRIFIMRKTGKVSILSVAPYRSTPKWFPGGASLMKFRILIICRIPRPVVPTHLHMTTTAYAHDTNSLRQLP